MNKTCQKFFGNLTYTLLKLTASQEIYPIVFIKLPYTTYHLYSSSTKTIIHRTQNNAPYVLI